MKQARKIKICMITPFQFPSEITPAHLLRFSILFDKLKNSGNELVVISSNNKLQFECHNLGGAKIYKVPTLGSGFKFVDVFFFVFLLFFSLRKVAAAEKPHIFYVSEILCAFGISLFRKQSDSIITFDVMGILYEETKMNTRRIDKHLIESNIYRFLFHLMLKSIDFITTVNKAHKQYLENITDKPVYVIRDGVDLHRFDLEDKEVDGNLPKKEDNTIFLAFVGKLSHHRLDLLFEILPELLQRNDNLKVLIIGGGPHYNYYCKKARQMGHVDERILFTDYMLHEKIPLYLTISDITYSDDWSHIGFPMKTFEYMAARKAMIIEDTEAVREVLTDGETALLYKNQNDLLTNLELLIRNSELRNKLGENARKCVEKYHIWDLRISQLMQIYNGHFKNKIV